MEAWVYHTDKDDEAIPYEDHEVDYQENCEAQVFQVGMVRKSQKKKSRCRWVILQAFYFGHFLSTE